MLCSANEFKFKQMKFNKRLYIYSKYMSIAAYFFIYIKLYPEAAPTLMHFTCEHKMSSVREVYCGAIESNIKVMNTVHAVYSETVHTFVHYD